MTADFKFCDVSLIISDMVKLSALPKMSSLCSTTYQANNNMTDSSQSAMPPAKGSAVKGTAFSILGAISVSHLLNDMIQSLILAIYPILQADFHLSFVQIGMITLTYQLTASLLQPLIGYYTDKHPQPYSLPIGMGFTLSGLLLLSVASTFPLVLLAAALVGTGSSVFHPESSRVARMASGGRHGLAQSLFQVGGNFGSSLGPLLAALIIAPYGKRATSPGSRWRRCWRSWCCCRSASGINISTGQPKGSRRARRC